MGGLQGMAGYLRDRDDTDAGLGQMAGLEQDLRKAQQSSAEQTVNRANENWRSRVGAAITDAQMAAQPVAAANQMAGEAARFNAMMPVYSAQADASTASAARTRGLAKTDKFGLPAHALPTAEAEGLFSEGEGTAMFNRFMEPHRLSAQTSLSVANTRADATGGRSGPDLRKQLFDAYNALIKQGEDGLKGSIAMFNPEAAEAMRARVRQEALQRVVQFAAAYGVPADEVVGMLGGQQAPEPAGGVPTYDSKTRSLIPGR